MYVYLLHYGSIGRHHGGSSEPKSVARLAQSDRASDFYGGPGDRIVNLKAASSTLAVG